MQESTVLDLSKLNWTLEGWRPFAWRLERSRETGGALKADVGPIPARVPGSVQENLRREDLLPNWNVGLQSRACEWTEHRHWLFEAELPSRAPGSGPVVLAADGLDYSGWILVDNVEVAAFQGTLVPHRFNLGESVTDGQPHRLAIVFDEPPREQGQIGYSSRSRFFKPRYTYSWDWTPRMVAIGIWDRLHLETGMAARFQVDKVLASLDEDLATGRVRVTATLEETAGAHHLEAELLDGDSPVATKRIPVSETMALDLAAPVSPWWPNGLGEAKTYRLVLRMLDETDAVLVKTERSVGFKRVEWRPCEGAPEDAEPWICVVNGTPCFLQGVNWVPPKLNYADANEADYRALTDLYRDMGCTIIRVWGGALLEKEWFYRQCDEAGIMVWQEFPLSSSGIENLPPDAPEAIATLTDIARSYIHRRAHHPSLLLWCGGNELTDTDTVPVDTTHPAIRAMADVVSEEDPDRRFLATSSSGPTFYALPENMGKGLHHDVHGPWGLGQPGVPDMEGWKTYWANDDALFRSETGMPGAQSLEAMQRYRGEEAVWPPITPYWRHTASWWTQWDRLKDQFGDMDEAEGLPAYIAHTQAVQADAYATAAAACKARFPRCGGFIIWEGHDCFPCPANNSVIEFPATPKPAYHLLRRIFRGK